MFHTDVTNIKLFTMLERFNSMPNSEHPVTRIQYDNTQRPHIIFLIIFTIFLEEYTNDLCEIKNSVEKEGIHLERGVWFVSFCIPQINKK